MFPQIIAHIEEVHIRLLLQILLQYYRPLRWNVLFRSVSLNFFSNAYFCLFSWIILIVCKILRTVMITRMNISIIVLEIICYFICHFVCQCLLLAWINLIPDSNVPINSEQLCIYEIIESHLVWNRGLVCRQLRCLWAFSYTLTVFVMCINFWICWA